MLYNCVDELNVSLNLCNSEELKQFCNYNRVTLRLIADPEPFLNLNKILVIIIFNLTIETNMFHQKLKGLA